MSMDSRYKDKIRKLLALAQSDNEHEAEAAKRQAKKLMAKYRIDADELEIISTFSKPIPRKNIKEYEVILISAIMDISGVFAMQGQRARWAGSRVAWEQRVEFVGLERDAELAAYSFDVLYQQVEQARKDFQKEYGANAAQADLYCKSWMYSAAKKLVNVFGTRERPESVKKHKAKKTEGVGSADMRKAKMTSSRTDVGISVLGSQDGSKANLNIATADQREPQLQLGGGL